MDTPEARALDWKSAELVAETLWDGKLCLPQRRSDLQVAFLFSKRQDAASTLWRLRRLCQAGACQPNGAYRSGKNREKYQEPKGKTKDQ